MKQLLKYAPALFLLVYLFAFYAVPVNLVVTDLGRHITNGVQILNGNWDVLYTNFYSFTEPQHAFTNHHWGTGVIFHLIHKAFGFTGLQVFYIILMLLTAAILIGTAPKKQRGIAIAATIFLTPLLAYRTELRPEGFSYLLMALAFFILKKYESEKWSFAKLLGVLLPLQILWVNLHIFWILGPGMAGVFILKALIDQHKDQTRQLALAVVLLITVSIINPFGLMGLLAPFNIFTEYGYMVAENQSLFFMLERTGETDLIYFIIIAVISLAVSTWLFLKKEWNANLVEILLSFGFLVLGFAVIRGITMFAFISIPLFVVGLNSIVSHKFQRSESTAQTIIVVFVMVFVMVGFFTRNTFISPLQTYQAQEKGKTVTKINNGLGLIENIHGSVDFFKNARLPGPIFNNYDIGSFLIFGLPDQKVFVDNRPEAYSVPLFKDIYQPMQEDAEIWNSLSTRYDIQSIFFNRHDNTPWGQSFLIRIVKDPNWIPVYVDGMTIILLKNTTDNAALIERYRLPDSMFGSRPN